jgi:hypothetical protein
MMSDATALFGGPPALPILLARFFNISLCLDLCDGGCGALSGVVELQLDLRVFLSEAVARTDIKDEVLCLTISPMRGMKVLSGEGVEREL